MGEKTILQDMKIREREARKNIIIRAAVNVFSRRPFDSVSLREIAAEAGISPSSIYTYFENQESLFIESFLHESTDLIEELERIINGEEGVRALRSVIGHFVAFFTEREAYFKMMTQFMMQGDLGTESTDRISGAMRRIFDSFDILFSRLRFQGETRLLSHYFFASLNGILITFRRYPGRSAEEVATHMEEIGDMLCDMLLCYCGGKGNCLE